MRGVRPLGDVTVLLCSRDVAGPSRFGSSLTQPPALGTPPSTTDATGSTGGPAAAAAAAAGAGAAVAAARRQQRRRQQQARTPSQRQPALKSQQPTHRPQGWATLPAASAPRARRRPAATACPAQVKGVEGRSVGVRRQAGGQRDRRERNNRQCSISDLLTAHCASMCSSTPSTVQQRQTSRSLGGPQCASSSMRDPIAHPPTQPCGNPLTLTGWPRMGMEATFCMAADTGGRKAGCMPPYGLSGGICGVRGSRCGCVRDERAGGCLASALR